MTEPFELPRISRRAALRWIGLVASAWGASGGAAGLVRDQVTGGATGYGSDPDLLAPPAEPWPLLLTLEQRAVAAGLLDVILPAYGSLPAASGLGLVDFLDEWLSAPYPQQRADRGTLVALLDAVTKEALRTSGSGFAQLAPARRAAMVETLAATGSPGRAAFRRLCVISAAAYYTTPAGMAAIGFVGNVPRASFDGPPQAVLDGFDAALRKLGP